MINFQDFLKVDIRVGRIKEVHNFPEAKKAAYKLFIDFGETIGIKKSSAQITENYSPEDLKDRLIVAVINFPPKQIATFISEVLVLGIPDKKGNVVLLSVDDGAEAGVRVY